MSFSPKQTLALEAMIAGKTITASARAAKINAATIHRWLDEPAFAAELQRRQEDALHRASGMLKAAAAVAIERLLLEMGSRKPLSGRISAADKLLSHTVRLSDAVEIRARLDDLEQQIEDLKNPQPHLAEAT